ncbi:hypothetical protein EWF20_04630 [Sulfolobus sp. S-194]|uniref:hypothetical protein n=1 Tax=Sulfolobus sp. S-194 TaxID=2512240 RepID=UPI0014371F27|nr:hypothetical protein [Sulfolobus sp. S-194]QIW23511.1 hypothetical protein EWF20_04630 [Sulfolobus sp. S-194]
MIVISSLLDKRMSDHNLNAKDVIDEILPKLLNSVHMFRSKGVIYAATFTNKYIWTMKINTQMFSVEICKYKYKYWELPDLNIRKVECYRLMGELLDYVRQKLNSVIAPSNIS